MQLRGELVSPHPWKGGMERVDAAALQEQRSAGSRTSGVPLAHPVPGLSLLLVCVCTSEKLAEIVLVL